MRLSYLIIPAFFLSMAMACSQVDPKPVAQPKPDNIQAEQNQFPDIQTLTGNHKILLIRVAGDLSHVSEGTKAKINTQTNAFNAAFEKFKTDIQRSNDLEAQLQAIKTGAVQGDLPAVETALKTANETTAQSQGQYDELARQFVQLIETVKIERAKNKQ